MGLIRIAKTFKEVERVYIDKPDALMTRQFNGHLWTVSGVSEIRKDLAGREYYEILLTRSEAPAPIGG